ncbi:MAG: hypothetical protein UR85_C0010G0020 [Candidatus Nomurabacteria bacterium GW2011_GWF2_35_66]|uniref:Uncharacterized protein n=1 Tax=Candidatus Nomurabacteria bacterium GW2011_GWE1_35_16 TaxID=1618761 RepID=A0A0G0BQI8_9BACT|nr:MAG: hypothetical protein UR55_C0016G0016 [Candidatus Nomurabacteria bacterium GW2011_GWF1_34_20]KKP61622.1 MAG: hypothetical protein UR57_C0015G0018 [Candidatus Nomurabacteria bacterium GW2011_GWE2_34_25]KKP65916.1 MAG: hypothetical protein UR64_C0016G0016 [Candidatus Nomurabacteria bacterium GW2011_GWE1_35_16]KKP82972.1 MAG: hypothetical protein UR85_C0010G0020 [Candidatus Nomurabacteria bacterium GW2011_GWF2_35_66]HAE36285.1 hypothetical protein [Candidatus Nomurabacteria bacterium]
MKSFLKNLFGVSSAEDIKEINKEPEFKKIIKEYKIDLSLVDSEEKAMENFRKCFNLFKTLCEGRMSGLDNMSFDDIFLTNMKGISCIEAVYQVPSISPYGIRARISIPDIDDFSLENPNLGYHIPVLTTGDHLDCMQDTLDFLAYQFIKEGLIVRFHL